MKKKVLSMMLAGAMTVSMLAGCGRVSDEAATTDNTAADTKSRDSRNNRSRRGTCRSIRKSGDIKNCVDVRRNRSE